MQAVILAGGLGTRLRPLVRDRAKPMALIGDRPFLEYLLLQVRKHGFSDVVLCIAHEAETIRRYFGSGDRWRLRLRYSHEPELRGTAGALKCAAGLIESQSFLVMNGDSFFDIDLGTLVRFHECAAALATLALAEVDRTDRFGTVEVADDGTIRGFREKDAVSRSGLVNGGIYVIKQEVLAAIPDSRAVSLEREIFPGLVGDRFRGVPFRNWFIDIGTPEDYLRLQADAARLLRAVT
jgi:D-glycero-alpha-D-manno-heptose 1-phosphate guanylyltransferase